jgi:hypothetical protein
MNDVRRGIRPHIRTSHVVAGAALVLVTAGSATAAGLITGKDIKNGSVTSKDVKNGSLVLKDFKKSERGKLVGPAGPAGGTGATGATGAAGPAGASAFAPPPSGTVVRGGGIFNVTVSAVTALRDYAPLPITTTQVISDSGPARNLYWGTQNAAFLNDADTNGVLCPGTAASPDPAAGMLCVYAAEVDNVAADNAQVIDGSVDGDDAADRSGFYVLATAAAAGEVRIRYVWAYKAP